jgi:catechol 2,3-dioxygenase-like lactoylglutathione lyase family enzyme
MEIPLKVAELDHVVLRCRNQARMLDFYTRVMGLNEERRIAQIGLIQLRAGASMIDLVPAAEPRIESGTNVDHFCLGIETADLQAAVNYLRTNSVEVLGEPAARYGARGMGNSIYVRDPEGNVVELKQMPPARAKREKE